jgi:transposase InsO family protein
MAGCLRIQPSGFYAWQKSPLSQRAREDARQTELIRRAWNDSGKVYGYRKLHDDLLDHGQTCCPSRVARLTRLAGIRAQIGYKRRPGRYGGKPSLAVDNTLDRQFDVAAPERSAGDAELVQRALGREVRLRDDPDDLEFFGCRVPSPAHFSIRCVCFDSTLPTANEALAFFGRSPRGPVRASPAPCGLVSPLGACAAREGSGPGPGLRPGPA